MDALSMLKYWRGGGGGGGGAASHGSAAAPTTIKAAVVERPVEETDDDEVDEDNDDEGPFFDLQFAVPDEEEEDGDGDEESDETDGEREEFDFAVSSGGSSGGGRADPDLSLSPSDDLFFKGRLVPLEPAIFSGAGEPNSKPAQIPAVSFLKSATKFRVFLLGFKKPRPPPPRPLSPPTKGTEPPKSKPAAPKPRAETAGQSKLFTVKFKVEEVPIVSLFTRDNSSRGGSKTGKAADEGMAMAEVDGVSEAKRLLSKYLKMIKPLYVRVSKRYGEKLRLSAQLGLGKGEGGGSPEQVPEQQPSPTPPAPTETTKAAIAGAGACVKKEKQQQGNSNNSNGNLPAGLRVVCKHLGKSRSASAAVGPAGGAPLTNQRKDDSLLQQQDGIQGAILHCKRSFNSSSPPMEAELPRCASGSAGGADKRQESSM